MALSGSYNYTESVSAATLIALALRRLGVLGVSETINATEEANALITLNLIIKEWTSEGIDIWLRKQGYLFLESPGEFTSYTVGTSGNASFTSAYAMTTLAADAAASATSITVTDDTNISDADVILVKQADGTFAVDAVSGAPSANVVTLTTGIASDTTASSGALVYSWATSSNISAKIDSLIYVARKFEDTTGDDTNTTLKPGQEIEVDIVGEWEYRDSATNRLQTGAPTFIFHRPTHDQSRLLIWPTGGGGYDKLAIQYRTHMQDLDAKTDTIDLPPEGLNPLAWQLAAEMASEYGVSEREMARLWNIAESKKNTFIDGTTEDASVIFSKGRPRG